MTMVVELEGHRLIRRSVKAGDEYIMIDALVETTKQQR